MQQPTAVQFVQLPPTLEKADNVIVKATTALVKRLAETEVHLIYTSAVNDSKVFNYQRLPI
jgi:hypothetical protein